MLRTAACMRQVAVRAFLRVRNMPRLIKMPPSASPSKTQTDCTMCGTCCQRGGPAFHQEDKPLIDQGIIPLRDLFTIRKGEMARDDIMGALMPLPTDLIKIKGKPGSWACRYLDSQNRCSIYEQRPLECRILKCWDTREIERIYSKNRLTRQDLIENVEGLWELVETHQIKCDYHTIRKLAFRLKSRSKEDAVKKLKEIIAYDRHIRALVFSHHHVDVELADFLLGAPLSVTLPRLGIYI